MKCFAPSFALTLLAAFSTVDALSIQSSDVTASSIGGLQTLEKTWTVTSAEQLRDLAVQIPGNLFVDYDASLKSAGVVAKIVVSGDSEDLINAFDVIPRESKGHQVVSEDSVKVHLKNEDATIKGYVLTQIFVADKSVLRELSVALTHDTVLGENVLVNNNASASVKISTAGSGGFFFTSQEKFAIETLKLSTAGSGGVQFQVASLQTAEDIKLSVAGSGNIALLAPAIQAAKLKSSTAGSGDVFVQSESLTVHDLETSISGSGTTTLSKSGSCIKQDISIAGSGSVASGSIVCGETDVSLAGSGDVVVQTTDTLKVSTSASGSVKYVNTRPHKISLSSFLSRHNIVSQAEKNSFKTYKTVEFPARSPLLLNIKTQEQYFSEDPSIHILPTENNNGAFASAVSFATTYTPSSSGGWNVVPIAGLAGVALAAVGTLVRKFRQQNKREEYAPLV